MQRLIILRGSMGVGKSTVAQKFRSFPNKFAYLKIDDFKNIFEHAEKETRPMFHGAANAALEYLLTQGYSVVMEGVFQNPAFIDKAAQVAKKNNVPYKVFELTASIETLIKRDKSREEVQIGCREPLGKQAIQSICDKLALNVCESAVRIDTEHMTVDEIAAFIDQEFQK